MEAEGGPEDTQRTRRVGHTAPRGHPEDPEGTQRTSEDSRRRPADPRMRPRSQSGP